MTPLWERGIRTIKPIDMTKKNLWLLIMAIVFVGAGVIHFINPGFYLRIMPWYLPAHLELIYISGICEILLGIGILPLKTRKISSLLIMVMLTLFLIIHVQMLIDTWQAGGVLFWIAVFRLPLQFVLIRWSWLVYKKYNKPFNFKKPVYH